MKQKIVTLRLRDFTSDDHPYGNAEGKKVFASVLAAVDANPTAKIFRVSMDGIVATDASFPRESVVSVAKQLRGEKAFYLSEFSDRDLIDNWHYAAKAKEQPLAIWTGKKFDFIGPELTSSAQVLLEYVLANSNVLASKVASDLDLSVPNASTRLKNLVKDGYLLRSEDVAESGGIEYQYHLVE